ncbi:hypothetical protein [Pseudomonas putida]|uniref:hypothetical protein n=1 Tax=Pseudomonas putida TaxID=303 RepID=UPI00081931F6|nr:hypothetical protein [Pseudomonas putida]OCT21284.1 hypothetical protein A6E23_21905 [Pseudomonas putida]OCT22677.1 hypothetical protein A6E20_15040 [Pseudomonas putida]OCT37391.1 hypothetical protein A6E24_20145 [Pseudomonas putida]
MKPIVLIGDKHDCPLHGEGEVISGTSSLTVKGRAAALALLLEAGLLLLQGRKDDKDRRFWSEVTAAALTSAAAGMELLAVGTEVTLRGIGENSVTARGAQVSLGRYRLWGAGLAAVGGDCQY